MRSFVVFIAADIEGTCGYVSWPAQPPEEFWHREQMTAEVNAAVEGALSGGATGFVVSDIHWTKQNIMPERLSQNAILIRGAGRKLMWMDGVEKTNLVFLIGFHARAGSPRAILPHTISPRVTRLVINGREVGEIFISAACAGAFEVPVGMITGDKAAVNESEELIPGVEKVAVKEGIGPGAAFCQHPAKALAAIRKAAGRAVRRAVNGEFSPYRVAVPVTMTMEFTWPAYADALCLVPGVLRSGDREITFVGSWLDVMRILSLFAGWIKEIPGMPL